MSKLATCVFALSTMCGLAHATQPLPESDVGRDRGIILVQESAQHEGGGATANDAAGDDQSFPDPSTMGGTAPTTPRRPATTQSQPVNAQLQSDPAAGTQATSGSDVSKKPLWFYPALAVFVISGVALIWRALRSGRGISVNVAPDPAPAPQPEPERDNATRPDKPDPASVAAFRLRDERTGQSILLDPAALTGGNGFCLGRSSDFSDASFEDADISRRHVRFRLAAGILAIEDLNSSQGTRLNGVALEAFKATPAKIGDAVQVASRSFVIVEKSG